MLRFALQQNFFFILYILFKHNFLNLGVEIMAVTAVIFDLYYPLIYAEYPSTSTTSCSKIASPQSVRHDSAEWKEKYEIAQKIISSMAEESLSLESVPGCFTISKVKLKDKKKTKRVTCSWVHGRKENIGSSQENKRWKDGKGRKEEEVFIGKVLTKRGISVQVNCSNYRAKAFKNWPVGRRSLLTAKNTRNGKRPLCNRRRRLKVRQNRRTKSS